LGGGQWGTPGGRIEANEDALAAVLREVREETGLRLGQLLELGAHKISMPHGAVHMTSFKARVPGTAAIRLNPEEHHAHAWFGLGSLLVHDDILWGIPTVLRDFELFEPFDQDPTLADGSQAVLLRLAKGPLT
jgi:8-oxo-dGTP pyrophosphatase MutT (NUDIX family)